MKLIPDWKKKFHKFWTVRISVVGLVIAYAYDALPTLQNYIPEKWYAYLFIVIGIARIIAQEKLNGSE